MKKRKIHKSVSLIEVEDPIVLTEIENDAALRVYLGERLSERCVSVQPQALPEVLRRLQAMGHLPRVIES